MEKINRIKKAVVIPCYRVGKNLQSLIMLIPDDAIDHIIVVDDRCPDASGEIAEGLNKKNCDIIYHQSNQGVGGAVKSGYLKALELGCEIIVKMDGDGQMDPKHLEDIIRPLLNNSADYTKGNRFNDAAPLKKMPKIRLFGNSILSFIVKLVSGYWDILDPTNGYTAIRSKVLEKLDLRKISKGYFFEINMLIELNIINAVVRDVPIPTTYKDEKSSLNIKKILLNFPPKLIKGFLRRIFLKYYIYDFNIASVYILCGVPLFLFGVLFGTWQWIDSSMTGDPRTTGTVMLVALPIIISFQMLLQAVNIDISSTPSRK